jgi:hypothetical protein
MKTISHDDFLEMSNSNPKYYNGRWAYFEKVCEVINTQVKPKTCLEIGAGYFTVCYGADVMDFAEKTYYGLPDGRDRTIYIHNANDVPFDFITDKKYDLFLALQVFEHLKRDKVSMVFAEAKRISKNIIISLPYKWDVPSNMLMYPSHHKIDEETVAGWTDGILGTPDEVTLIPSQGEKISQGEKMIFVWKNV